MVHILYNTTLFDKAFHQAWIVGSDFFSNNGLDFLGSFRFGKDKNVKTYRTKSNQWCWKDP